MSNEQGQPDNGAYIGKGVTFRGSISAPEAIIVEGTIEGDVTAQTVRIGVGGTIRGNVVANEADVQGTISEKVVIKDFLLLRSTGRVEGQLSCGELQVERGAMIKGDFVVGDQKSQTAKPETPSIDNLEVFPPTPSRPKLQAAE
jgi:cytoskeletal protein CcmA (bactofilin family)